MRAEFTAIDLEEKKENRWYGEVTHNGQKVAEVIGFYKVRKPEDIKFEDQDPRSITLMVKTLSKEEKGDLLGYLNFKVTAKGSVVIQSREIKIPNTELCMPMAGWLNESPDGFGAVRLEFDKYYYENQRKYWEGKRDYVLVDGSTTEDEEDQTEIPF